MASLLCCLLSTMSTERRGSGSSELPGISFVAWGNVTLMTEQGKRYHSLLFYPVFHCFTTQKVSQRQHFFCTSAIITPSCHTKVSGLVMHAEPRNNLKEYRFCLTVTPRLMQSLKTHTHTHVKHTFTLFSTPQI